MKGLFLIAALASLSFAEEVNQDENVYVLTDDNFQSFIDNNEFAFVKFYAPWCGHCKKMAPDYSKLGEKVHSQHDNIKIAKLDATEHKKMSEKFGVQGFPTLKFFVKGNPVDYQGAREYDALYNWIQKKTGPASKELGSDSEYDTHSQGRFSVLYILPEGDQTALD